MLSRRSESQPRLSWSLSLRDVLATGLSQASLALAAGLHICTQGGRLRSRAEPGPKRGGWQAQAGGFVWYWHSRGLGRTRAPSRSPGFPAGTGLLRDAPWATRGPCCGAGPGRQIQEAPSALVPWQWGVAGARATLWTPPLMVPTPAVLCDLRSLRPVCVETVAGHRQSARPVCRTQRCRGRATKTTLCVLLFKLLHRAWCSGHCCESRPLGGGLLCQRAPCLGCGQGDLLAFTEVPF